MATAQKTQKPASQNGNGNPDPLAQAIAHEQAIAEEAKALRENATDLTPELFAELLPLLRKPIPQGFIVTTSATEGKPYPSTGIKSLQVQIDRLDNVLGPLNWSWETTWEQDGKLAEVVVSVQVGDRTITRRSRGGVNRGSTVGNLYKGSETNAAKLAFARLGPGHEVYLGATDHDPDVDEDAAKEQAKADPAAPLQRIDGEKVAELLERAQEWLADTQDEDEAKSRKRRIATALGSVGAAGKTIAERIASLTPKQADEFSNLLDSEIGGESK